MSGGDNGLFSLHRTLRQPEGFYETIELQRQSLDRTVARAERRIEAEIVRAFARQVDRELMGNLFPSAPMSTAAEARATVEGVHFSWDHALPFSDVSISVNPADSDWIYAEVTPAEAPPDESWEEWLDRSQEQAAKNREWKR